MQKSLELRVPPLLLFLITALLMWLVSRVTPALPLPDLPRRILIAGAVVISAAIGIAGIVAFRKASTTVNPLSPEKCSALVASGVFRFTRNPMYLALLLALLGWAVYLDSPWSLLLPAAFVLYMNRYQIVPEERALDAAFGEAFRQYRASVRRWL